MKNIFPGRESTIIYMKVQDLPYDLKRTLRMQFKEFVNFVEDAQLSRRPLKSENNVSYNRFTKAGDIAAA